MRPERGTGGEEDGRSATVGVGGWVGVGVWGRDGLVAKTTSVDSDLLIDGGAVLTGMGLLMRFVPEILELYVEIMRTEDVAEAEKGVGGVVGATGVDESSPPPRGDRR